MKKPKKSFLIRLLKEWERFNRRQTQKKLQKNYGDVNSQVSSHIKQMQVYYVDILTQYVQTTGAEIVKLHREIKSLKDDIYILKQKNGLPAGMYAPAGKPQSDSNFETDTLQGLDIQ